MPAKEEKDAPVETVTPEEAERLAHDRDALPGREENPEVRPDEFIAGIGQPVGGSAWPEEIVEELRKPLDPNRVRTKAGRGAGKLEYLAGHDVKRRASEIFGFGNWGHRVVTLEEIDAIPVQRTNDGNTREGWQVAYRCIVRIWIRHGAGLFETDGVGFGDGVEYTAGARVLACELAMKEAETDALKRAFTDLGDQFGLILYAKADEKKRIEKDRDRDDARPVYQQDAAGRPRPVPQSWTEWLERFAALRGGTPEATAEAKAWLAEAVEVRYGVQSIRELSVEEAKLASQGAASVLLALEESPDDLLFHDDPRKRIQEAFASKWRAGDGAGVVLEGPLWRLGPGEVDRTPYEPLGTPAAAE